MSDLIELCQKAYKSYTREQIRDGAGWLPFTLLYEQLIKDGILEPLATLDQESKRKYWDETTGSKHRRIFVSQALYVYDKINLE
jgi:hypothetical protein